MSLVTVFTAEPGEGKTSAALARIKKARAVFFCPSPKNKNAELNKLPWVFARDLNPDDLEETRRFQEKYPQVRVVLGYGEAPLLQAFMGDEWEGYVFVFDDFPQLFPRQRDFEQVIMFIAGIRHRDCLIIVTTQRVLGVCPPYLRTVADEITQCGPLVAEDEARVLYTMGGSAKYPRFREFYKAISTNAKYAEFRVKGVDSHREP